jgi:hypothetical protein
MAEALALDLVTARIRDELGRERARGNPLKAAYDTVARRLGFSPRRVRAYHHGEVPAADVTAAELLAADAAWRREIETTKARIAALEGTRLHDMAAYLPRDLAPSGLDAAGQGLRRAGGAMAAPADPLAATAVR